MWEMIKLLDTYSGGAFTPDKWKAEGYTGVIFKAGQGQWADVPRYHPEWWTRAKEAGLMTGWYWLADSRHKSADHITEMERVNLFADLGELGLWLDVEKPVISMTEAGYWSTKYAGYKNVIDLAYLLKLKNIHFGIYTGPGAYELVFRNAPKDAHDYIAQFDLWTAQYPYVFIAGISKPKLYGSWKTWTLWQYREGPDVNIFNGTDAEFFLYFDSEPTTTPEIPEQPTGVFTLKGTAKALTNIKPMDGGATLAVMGVGDYAYGDKGTTDLTGFTHYYRAGLKIELGKPCKAYLGNLTLTNEPEVIIVDPPEETGVIKTHTIEVFSDGSIAVDGVKY
jgi:hypothetical protein